MTWEYKLVVKDRRFCAMTTQELNNLGYQGWELVNKIKNEHKSEFIFKRPMKCENCKFYKTKLIQLRYGQVLGKSCIEGNFPENWDGCEKFKSKDD